jgi:hypothetical protein
MFSVPREYHATTPAPAPADMALRQDVSEIVKSNAGIEPAIQTNIIPLQKAMSPWTPLSLQFSVTLPVHRMNCAASFDPAEPPPRPQSRPEQFHRFVCSLVERSKSQQAGFEHSSV